MLSHEAHSYHTDDDMTYLSIIHKPEGKIPVHYPTLQGLITRPCSLRAWSIKYYKYMNSTKHNGFLRKKVDS